VSLHAETRLPSAEVLSIVKQAAGYVKGGGASLLTSGIQNVGARIHVTAESEDRLALAITSGKQLITLATLPATVEVRNGVTLLQVGGLLAYRTTQGAFLGVVPTGPKAIAGISLYKRFLEEVRTRILAKDHGARAVIN
jgi:hypothetical protein